MDVKTFIYIIFFNFVTFLDFWIFLNFQIFRLFGLLGLGLGWFRLGLGFGLRLGLVFVHNLSLDHGKVQIMLSLILRGTLDCLHWDV